METGISRFFRHLFWPFIVIAAINIENWANKNGYSSFLTAKIDDDSFLGVLLFIATSPPIIYTLVFLAGGISFAFVNYWWERLEYRHQGPPRWILMAHLVSARDALAKPRKSYLGTAISSIISKANKSLAFLQLPQIKGDPTATEEARKAYYAYLHAIVPLVETRQDYLAQVIARDYIRTIDELLTIARDGAVNITNAPDSV